jgi:D-alanyl-lipoteichoic acid acyltransferase DltB (MBOAT superfamily)
MIFSSYGFLFIFLPLVICAYFIANSLNRKNLAKWILVFGSFFFYWYGAGVFVIGFAASVLWNYAIGVKLGHIHEAGMAGRGRLLLAIGIGGNVAFLGYFKYTDFLIQNINFVANAGIPLQHIILPIGISFFTFQLIAYLVDSFRGQTRNYRFLDYLLFIAFFPQLIVGPIVHHAEMVPQFEAPATQRIDWNNIAIGLFYLSLGLAKKVILADPMTRWAQAGFDNVATMTFFTAWLNSFLYTVSYYFDLSGYADMAIGLGWLFNIRIPENFNSPYKALNFADYWRRWHITLSRFLSDYIFRNVYRSGAGSRRFYSAVFVTFLISGLWHGAGWNFVLWGILNGLFVMASHFGERRKWKLPIVLAWAGTFLGVLLLRVLFVSTDLSDAATVYSIMASPGSDDFLEQGYAFLRGNYIHGFFGLVAFAICVFAPTSRQLRERFTTTPLWGLGIGMLLLLSMLGMNQPAPFLYYQF